MNYISRVGIDFKTVGSKDVSSTDALILRVCNHFGISKAGLMSKNRIRAVMEARTILCYLLTQKKLLTSTATGKMLDISHATVLHHAKKVIGFMLYDEDYKKTVNSFI